MPFNFGMVLESDFHQLNCFVHCISNLNDKLVVGFALIQHLFKVDVGFR